MEGGTEHDLLSLVNQESDKEDSKGVEEEKVVETASEGAETEEGIEKEPHTEHVQDSPKKGYYYILQQRDKNWHWCNFSLHMKLRNENAVIQHLPIVCVLFVVCVHVCTYMYVFHVLLLTAPGFGNSRKMDPVALKPPKQMVADR